MIGLILAGGNGTRLYPITGYLNKHFINIFNKPIIYYPLSSLMLLGIKEYIIVCKKSDLINYKKLLGDGSNIGLKIKYVCQDEPKGILHCLKISLKKIGKRDVMMILGDNFFYGETFPRNLDLKENSKIFLYYVNSPSQYGVASLKKGKLINLVEKPKFIQIMLL